MHSEIILSHPFHFVCLTKTVRRVEKFCKYVSNFITRFLSRNIKFLGNFKSHRFKALLDCNSDLEVKTRID
jgi:hypothetical protein